MNRNCLDDPTGGENMSFSINGMPAQNCADYDAPAKQALEPLVRLFGGKVSAVFVERDSAAIPAPLRNPLVSAGSTRQPALPLIGIECGSASAGLGGVVFQNQAAADAYLKDNPVLRNTLITSWPPSAVVIWIRPDWSPRNVSLAGVHWTSAGIIPVALPGEPLGKHVLGGGAIASPQFMDLTWPSGLKEAFEILLLERVLGPKYRRLGPGKVVLNRAFWATFLAGKMGLVYRVEQEGFFRLKSGEAEQLEPVTTAQVFIDTTSLLQQAAMLDPQRFPVGQIRLPVIKSLVEHMKVAVAVHTPTEREVLVRCLTEQVEKRKGGNVTVAELWVVLVEYCGKRSLPCCPRRVFNRALSAVMREMYGMLKSHDLQRPGANGKMGWRYGFHGLALKRSEAKPEPAECAEQVEVEA